MYKCEACKQVQKAGTKQVKYVAETRTKTYQNVIRRGRKEHVINSEGSEIVREIPVCSPCAQANTIS